MDNPAQFQQGCESAQLTLSSNFAGGRANQCTAITPRHFEVTITPEDAPPINNSPWYAFKISPNSAAADAVTITLRYSGGEHRYIPKLRRGEAPHAPWRPMPADAVTVFNEGRAARFAFALRGAPVWVAGQPLILPATYNNWAAQLAANAYVQRKQLGESREGRPLMHLQLGAGERLVLLLGRQHPPEVPGALALLAFVERLAEADALAAAFRAQYTAHVFPLLNPDGVARGHWRHSAAGADMNRDWGPFKMRETQQVRDFLRAQHADERLRVMLDFHATRRAVFYTPTDGEAPFLKRWFACMKRRGHADVAELRSPRESGTQANAKNYFYHRYKIPSVTYEAADEMPPAQIRAHARASAATLMRTLLNNCGDDAI